MNRRNFLKGIVGAIWTALAIGVSGLPLIARSAAAQVLLQSRLLQRTFQGTRDGRILESLDGGATWQEIAKFGSHCSIQALLEGQGKVFAQISVQGHSFLIATADARTWRMIDGFPVA